MFFAVDLLKHLLVLRLLESFGADSVASNETPRNDNELIQSEVHKERDRLNRRSEGNGSSDNSAQVCDFSHCFF